MGVKSNLGNDQSAAVPRQLHSVPAQDHLAAMGHFNQHNKAAFAAVRSQLSAPVRRSGPRWRHLLAAAAFAAATAMLSATAIIFGAPGLDHGAQRFETSVWGVVKAPRKP